MAAIATAGPERVIAIALRGARRRPQRLAGDRVHYPNCSAARAAGAAPVRQGTPGYGRHLDRDDDGIGCE